MGIIIVAPIVAFVLVFWYFMFDEGWKPCRPFRYNNFFEVAGVSCLIALLALVISFLASLVLGAFFAAADMKVLTRQEQKLYALSDGNEIEGSFFLGSGSIDDNMKYVYIVEIEDKGYKMKTLGVNHAYINYTDETPTLVTISYVFDNNILNFFAVPFESHEYIFNIPEGSITNSYIIDME